jgi:crotonobetainyl-CoA:carnitine CoA-transferase CaiB-like acyl-CoA transferase
VRNDAEWTALCQVFATPEWTHDARFANSLGRWKHVNLLDRYVAGSTEQRDPLELAASLRAAGVPSALVQTNRDMLSDEHLRARQAFWVIAHALTGTYPYPAPSTRLTRTPPRLARPAPNLGEHNIDILTRLLGLSAAAIHDLEVQGVIGTVAY